MPSTYDVEIARMRAAAAEHDARLVEEESRRWRPQLPPRPPAIGVELAGGEAPPFDDVAWWDEVEREHDYAPAPAASLEAAIRTVNARRRAETMHDGSHYTQLGAGLRGASRVELEQTIERLELESIDATGDRAQVVEGALRRAREELEGRPPA